MLRSTRRADIMGAGAGIATAVLLFVSVAAVDPQRGVSDQELLDWWADSGSRDAFVFSMYTLLLAGPLFLLFVTRLRARVQADDPAGWSDVLFGCGIVATTALGVCAVTRGVVAASVRFGDEPVPGVDTLRFATNLAYGAWIPAILFAALVVAISAVLGLAHRVLPRWHSWLGVVVAAGSVVLLAAQIGQIALPLLNIWLIASSVAFLRAPVSTQVAEPSWQPEVATTRA